MLHTYNPFGKEFSNIPKVHLYLPFEAAVLLLGLHPEVEFCGRHPKQWHPKDIPRPNPHPLGRGYLTWQKGLSQL